MDARKKIGVGVLVLALVALGVDRLFFSSGDAAIPAVAESVGPIGAKPAVIPVVAKTPGNEAASTALISDELKAIPAPDLSQIPDAFSPSIAWLATTRPATPAPEHDPRAEIFVATHKLTAVLASSIGGTAIVDGAFVRVGQRYGGFMLASVGTRTARFTDGTAVADLKMDP